MDNKTGTKKQTSKKKKIVNKISKKGKNEMIICKKKLRRETTVE